MGDTTPRLVKVTNKKAKTGGKSKKGAQHVHNQSINKYGKQRVRTTKNKIYALAKHLLRNPNDLQNQIDIKRVMETL